MTHAAEPSGYLPERTPPTAIWRWRLLDGAGADVTDRDSGPDGPATLVRFTSQSDAETWIGEMWRDLLESGVEAVTLMEGDREVYGPMSLRPAGT